MRSRRTARTVIAMPRRPPIDPQGIYHVGSRGVYGQILFANANEHEVFLGMYDRISRKYEWGTLTWVLMPNHHHFVIQLTRGGLSEGMRELHGGFSRWRHQLYGQTRMGHLVRHGFFARELETAEHVISACIYVDLNPMRKRVRCAPRKTDWGGFAATIGLVHPRRFHHPARLLELIHPRPATARLLYRRLVSEVHAFRNRVASPNDGSEPQRRGEAA